MPTLEFVLDPHDAAPIARWPGIQAARRTPTTITWYDTEDSALADDDLALCALPGRWTLSRLSTASAAIPPRLLGEARRPELLGHALPDALLPKVRLQGIRRSLRLANPEGSVDLRLVEGHLSTRGRPSICRLTLDGPGAMLAPLALAMAADLGLHVPRSPLAQVALFAAQNQVPPPRALGAPKVDDGSTVTESLAAIAGHLLAVMLHWADQIDRLRTPEPVHQMRVATRRLRSALSVYKQVAACPELASLTVPLKLCAARLGTARDWDVFLGGLGARLAETFPDDRRCSAMLRAASRRRRAAYKDLKVFVAGPDFRTLTVALACAAALRPWDEAAPPEGLQQDSAVFAATVLAKRMKRVRQAGRDIENLPIPALHELRKDCKRLRYAAEFFTSLFPQKRVRRFVLRLAELQEELGLLNDTAAVSGLMAQLGRLERSYAAGLVEGFSAAHAGPARTRITGAWKRFKAAEPFWVG